MKQLLSLILIFSFLYSCDNKKLEKTQSEFKPKTEPKTELKIEPKTELKVEPKIEPKKLDTTVIYWRTDFDTIRKNQEMKIGNENHQLELKTYSLNDSSIVRINDLNKPIIYKEIYHDNVTEIILRKGNEIVLKSLVKKSTFKDSLDGDFLKHSVLRAVEYDFIRSNRLYFKAHINVPDTDWSLGTDFAIFYQTEKKGKIDFWNIKDIGL